MFLLAYRAFLDAMAQSDKKTLRKMTEPSLFRMINRNLQTINEHDSQLVLVAPEKKREMNLKLLDL
jgi:hypothetical protein